MPRRSPSDLRGRAAPLLVISAVGGLAALGLLRRQRWASARLGASVVAVAAIVIGWGVAQYPDLIAGELTLDDAAGAHATLVALVVTFGIAAVTAVPALLWLFVLVNRSDWATEADV